MIRVAINGFGRIGRNILRIILENRKYNNIKIIAINDLNSLKTKSHLIKYDSIHGQFKYIINEFDDYLIINNHKIICFYNLLMYDHALSSFLHYFILYRAILFYIRNNKLHVILWYTISYNTIL